MVEQLIMIILDEIDQDIDMLKESLMTSGLDSVPGIRARITQAQRDKSLILQAVKRYRKDQD